MKIAIVGVGLLAAVAAGYALSQFRPVDAAAPESGAEAAPPTALAAVDSPAAEPARPDFASLLAEVPKGERDPLSKPMTTGIVFYGTWEDAMAEVERTGKPVLLHFGSPRRPSGSVCVPGTW